MTAYRISIIITGDDFNPTICDSLLGDCPIHIFEQWSKFDNYCINNTTYQYHNGGCILLHNDIYAISEEKKNLILDDYILFLKTNLFRLKLSGASKFIITFSTYTNKEIRFLLMRWQEMEKLVAFKDIGINVTLDIFLFSKNKYNYIIRDMNKERKLYEKV